MGCQLAWEETFDEFCYCVFFDELAWGLLGEDHDLRGSWMFRLLGVCLVTLAVAQLLPAFSRFLLVFLRLCAWLRLVSGLAQLPSFWLPVD